MTAARINTEERKKLITDLWIIGIVSFLALGVIVFAMQNGMNDFAGGRSIPIVLRVLAIGLCGQFAVSGLGISIVPQLLIRGRAQNLVVRPLEPQASRTIALALPEGEALPVVEAFAQTAVRWVKENRE